MLVRKVWDHAIDLNDNFKASKVRVYPLSRNKKEKIQKFVNEHLKKEYIRPSKSPQMSPVFFVGKKDGEKCMIMDYHRLNKQTVSGPTGQSQIPLRGYEVKDEKNLTEFPL